MEGQLYHVDRPSRYWKIVGEDPKILIPQGEREGKKREKILDLVSKNPTITIQEMAEDLDLTTRTISNVIKELKEEKRLHLIPYPKQWKITEKDEIIKSPQERKKERKERILDLVRENPKITIREMADDLGLSVDTTREIIKELKVDGLLYHVSSPRYWKVQNKTPGPPVLRL